MDNLSRFLALEKFVKNTIEKMSRSATSSFFSLPRLDLNSQQLFLLTNCSSILLLHFSTWFQSSWNQVLYEDATKLLQNIQMKLILLCVWAEQAVLGRVKTALNSNMKSKYRISANSFRGNYSFLEESRRPKSPFEINWPLVYSNFMFEF